MQHAANTKKTRAEGNGGTPPLAGGCRGDCSRLLEAECRLEERIRRTKLSHNGRRIESAKSGHGVPK
jgi:hypothetical protein